MNSTMLATTHIIVVTIFLLIYFVKTIFIFANQQALEKFSRIMKVPEMIISLLFLGTGVWMFFILGAFKAMHIIKLILIFISIPLAVIGFKKKNKALALVSFLFIVSAYGLAEMSKNKPFIPIDVISTGDEFTGFKTFAANCSMCHGTDGKKMYRNATDLSLSTLNPSLISQMVREGSKGRMPAFSGTLSEDEINAVTLYVQSLRSK